LSGVLFALMDFIVEKREQIDIGIIKGEERK
jgi:hypothetical protein